VLYETLFILFSIPFLAAMYCNMCTYRAYGLDASTTIANLSLGLRDVSGVSIKCYVEFSEIIGTHDVTHSRS